MENCSDNGAQWRARLRPFLKSLGIKIFDPTDKPINIGSEKLEDRNYHQLLRRHLDYEVMAEVSKIIRDVDFRMVNIVDFLVRGTRQKIILDRLTMVTLLMTDFTFSTIRGHE